MRPITPFLAAILLALLAPATAFAGGYDTPMLYSARHMGMGGTAVGYVHDPSAMFHNPAGLGQIQRISLLADISLLIGGIQSSPATADQNIDSETTFAPFFLVGGGFRILESDGWVPGLTAGIAVYPVASAGAEYIYDDSFGQRTVDETTLVFFEVSPGVALDIEEAGLRIGAGYRLTLVQLDRRTNRDVMGTPTDTLRLDMSGLNFLGFRVGAQWDAVPDHLSLGIAYRHKTTTVLEANNVQTPIAPGEDAELDFRLPSRLTMGVRGDYMDIGGAVDVEIGFNGQNNRQCLEGTISSGPLMGTRLEGCDPDDPMGNGIPNVLQWSTAVTLRVGGEYRIHLGDDPDRNILTPRLGYVFDARTANKSYPTAFGTPPGPTHVITGGIGFDGGPWEVNAAYAYRLGSATVTMEDIDAGTETCVFCSKAGEYNIHLNGIYVDFSYDFE